MADKTFLGTGMKFPPEVDPITGRIRISTEEKSVKESIYLILMTRRTERLTRPFFGSNIDSYAFMDVSVTTLTMVTNELENMILSQEPRIRSVDVDIDPQLDEGRLIITIRYMIAETNTPDNLVFPYYFDQEAEVEVPVDEYEDFDMDEVYEDSEDDDFD